MKGKANALAAATLGGWLLASTSATQALTVATLDSAALTATDLVYETVGTLTDTNFFFQDTFEITTAGSYTVTLTDLAAGIVEPFRELGLLLTTPTQVLANLSAPGTTSFDFSGLSTDVVTAIVIGRVGNGPFPSLPGFGIFGLEVAVAPVPIPAGFPLLLSALIGLFAIGRKSGWGAMRAWPGPAVMV
jgi:hypothetical protein